jgi:hypothetical protein
MLAATLKQPRQKHVTFLTEKYFYTSINTFKAKSDQRSLFTGHYSLLAKRLPMEVEWAISTLSMQTNELMKKVLKS